MDESAVLLALLRVPSPSGQEAAAVRAFTHLAEDLGLSAQVDDAGNGIATAGSGGPEVLFLGHIDTVDGELPVRVEGGRIYGRGACDAKAALAAALLAARGADLEGKVTIVAAVGEEDDSRGARSLVDRDRPDFLIVGEPSGWSGITVGYKGSLTLTLRREGPRAHLSSPESSTIECALAGLDRLRAFVGSRGGSTPFSATTMKIYDVQTTRMGGRESVEVGVNIRLPPGVPTNDVLEFLEAGGWDGAFRMRDRSEGIEVDRRNPVVRALSAGIRSLGAQPTLYRKSGTSDLNIVAPIWGCPAAVYGPGDSHLDHTDGERVDLDDLRKSVRVLQTAFSRLFRHSARVLASLGSSSE